MEGKLKRACTLIFILFCSTISSQEKFTKADKLRGSITQERAWWDIQKYELAVEVFPEKKSIKGVNIITYKVIDKAQKMQIDLQAPMEIDRIEQNGKKLKFTSQGAAHFIKIKSKQPLNSEQQITIYFSGKPREAKNAPWDGGIVWQKDNNGKDFIATANQGIGASIWWPNKDHAYDEPDNGLKLDITAPKELVAVGNGRLTNETQKGKTKTWTWEVVNPINNYGVNLNIGDYVNFSEVHEGIAGDLDMSYWVLRDNLEKAKEQFTQAKMMMQAFEYWFGPYPFYEDSFKLVEVPYLGMEHQSSVTYGNKYMNGYLGRDLSDTGWGLRFDFIIIHEAGHEWFANNITHIDVADMWIHEGFTAYSENLYLDYHYSKEASSEYVIGTRRGIQNDRPIIGTYGVHHEGSSDMYYKGANILHTLRQLVEDDKKWRAILKGINKEFYHQTVSSAQVEQFLSEQSGIDLTQFWEQYLRTTMIPKLEYKLDDNKMTYRYVDIIDGFDMPVIMIVDGDEEWITPNAAWQTKTFSNYIGSATLKQDFFIKSQMVE